MLEAQGLRSLEGFGVNKKSKRVPILQFADDTVLLLEANEDEIDNLRGILVWF